MSEESLKASKQRVTSEIFNIIVPLFLANLLLVHHYDTVTTL